MAIYLNGSKIIPKGQNGNQIISVPSKYWDIPYLRTSLTFANKVIGTTVLIDAQKKSEYEVINIKWSDGMVQEKQSESIILSRPFTLIGTYVAKISDTVSSIKLYPNDTLVSIDNIAEGLPSLASEAFKNSTSLKTAVIPSTITQVGSNVFSGCTSLEALYFNGRNESEIMAMSNYNSWITNVPDSQIVLIYWKKGSDFGCFVYGHPDAILLTDENTDTINFIVTENNDFINKD